METEKGQVRLSAEAPSGKTDIGASGKWHFTGVAPSGILVSRSSGDSGDSITYTWNGAGTGTYVYKYVLDSNSSVFVEVPVIVE